MKKFMWIFSGICLMILGIYLILNPLVALNYIAITLAIIILIQGVAGIIDYSNSKDTAGKGWDLFSAIINTIFGILILFSPLNLVLTAMIPIMFGIWVMIKGFIQCIESIYLNKIGSEIWGYVLTFGILNFLLGILMLVNPFIPAFTLAFYIGMGFIVTGLSSIFVRK